MGLLLNAVSKRNDMEKILIVDDEEDICEILKFNLENSGYVVDTARSAEEALTLPIQSYQLLLLDVMMGQMSGYELASRLKKDPATKQIPIIFITAKTAEADTLKGFSLGADDYITKPFRLSEVQARVRAVLRRGHTAIKESPMADESDDGNILVYADLQMNLLTKLATIDGKPLPLTKTEFEILLLLMSHRGIVFSREQILKAVWPGDVYVLSRSVDVNIARIRKKLGRYADRIVSRIGYGYCFEE